MAVPDNSDSVTAQSLAAAYARLTSKLPSILAEAFAEVLTSGPVSADVASANDPAPNPALPTAPTSAPPAPAPTMTAAPLPAPVSWDDLDLHLYDPANTIQPDEAGSYLDSHGHDRRAVAALPMFAGLTDWPMNVETRLSCPSATKYEHVANELATLYYLDSNKARRQIESICGKNNLRPFLIDSGATDTQIPEQYEHLLTDVHDLDTIVQLYTASDNPLGPRCTRAGILTMRLPPHEHPIRLPCLLRPGKSDMWLVNYDQLEAYRPPDLDVQTKVRMYKNEIKMGRDIVPIYRIHGAPHVIPEIGESTRNARASHACAQSRSRPAPLDAAEVHSILAHAHAKCCLRTLQKCKGGLPFVTERDFDALFSSPCVPCAMRMQGASVGNQQLNTGLQHPTQPGELLCVNGIGPFPVAGLKGERYILLLTDVYTQWTCMRAVKTKDEFKRALEEMLVEAKTKLRLPPGLTVRMTLHSDTDASLVSDAVKAILTTQHVLGHRAVPYNPKTNPYIERAVGVLLQALRARLVDSKFPPKYWSVLAPGCVWTLNRLVRSTGYAPIEVFENKPIDFTGVYSPGILVYWHLDPRNRVDSKLGPSGGVASYVRPGDAVNQAGHQVCLPNGRVFSVTHVLPDKSVKPHGLGLTQTLLAQSAASLGALPEDADPNSYVTSDGVDAFSLIGAEIVRDFTASKFRGRVVSVRLDGNKQGKLLFRIDYEDNDREELYYEELRPLLARTSITAATFASVNPAFWTSSVISGYDVPTTLYSYELPFFLTDADTNLQVILSTVYTTLPYMRAQTSPAVPET